MRGQDFASLDLSRGPLLKNNLEFLNECLDKVVAEQQKVGALSLWAHFLLLQDCKEGGALT